MRRAHPPILLFHGPSDRGKSTLLNEYQKVAQDCPPLRCGRGEFKGGPTLREVLWNIVADLSPAVRFHRFERAPEADVPESLRTAFLWDLSEATATLVHAALGSPRLIRDLLTNLQEQQGLR